MYIYSVRCYYTGSGSIYCNLQSSQAVSGGETLNITCYPVITISQATPALISFELRQHRLLETLDLRSFISSLLRCYLFPSLTLSNPVYPPVPSDPVEIQ